ncbi:hypothetical protein OGAPHI_000603 [Ogataea philodendri]|uniref:Uncharacterized protein n=1 Tax=Ogataea philodendri TaxID=1378263 RepID=A0A9P8PF56_9ASCO|nr:uncharacterized protein OGAPHI_000603 [Ogataea philodendri]KAH3670892.1 hypothetical protein OGAPHI_000603 [Ogataea philodendri]
MTKSPEDIAVDEPVVLEQTDGELGTSTSPEPKPELEAGPDQEMDELMDIDNSNDVKIENGDSQPQQQEVDENDIKQEFHQETVPSPHENATETEKTKSPLTQQDSVPSDFMFTSKPEQETTITMTSLEKQTHTIVLPSYSSWFDMKKVHKIEKDSFPEFFNESNKNKTPQIYAKYRNFMINSYRLNPNEYLSFTAIRRNLVGDAGTLLRLHKFLDKWGLINYQVDPETRPVPVEPPYTGDFTVDFDTPRGLFPFESYKPPVELPDLTKLKELLKSSGSLESSNGDSVKRRKIIKPDINKGWSETDLEKLVEGVKQFPNEWYKIAEHVGNKTPEQCILRFLQFPIEDEFLEKNKELLGPLKYVPNLSFSPNDNPIMSTLAFLTTLVDSDAAHAAAARANKVLDDKTAEKLDKPEEVKEESETDPLQDVKDAAATTFGLAAARSHVFANYEEREMNKAMTSVVNNTLKLVELKLGKLSKLDKLIEYQKKQLASKGDELFLDRLSFFKTTNSVSSKLLQAIEILEQQGDVDSKVKKLVTDARELILKPQKTSLNVLGYEAKDEEPGAGEEEEVKPVSYETPQLYRYWSG